MDVFLHPQQWRGFNDQSGADRAMAHVVHAAKRRKCMPASARSSRKSSYEQPATAANKHLATGEAAQAWENEGGSLF